MGASQSSPQPDEKVFISDTSLHFSEDVVHQLVDHQTSPDTPHDRQLTIDAHIRARIQSELSHLHQEEERVREEIERALEKENLDRERRMAGEDSASEEAGPAGSVKSSAALMGDLEELRQKVEKYHARQNSEELSAVRTKGEEVVLCYQSNPTTTLDCWKVVEEFKASVGQVEQCYVNSFR
ncbi:hypothetical protein LXA43DRAFT_1014579 [Ganoderma leucocontextum]|nr:hypothetical protein LXA43DRAFT_1014579 [Ganoderma leucocontextum]